MQKIRQLQYASGWKNNTYIGQLDQCHCHFAAGDAKIYTEFAVSLPALSDNRKRLPGQAKDSLSQLKYIVLNDELQLVKPNEKSRIILSTVVKVHWLLHLLIHWLFACISIAIVDTM